MTTNMHVRNMDLEIPKRLWLMDSHCLVESNWLKGVGVPQSGGQGPHLSPLPSPPPKKKKT